MKLTLFLAVIVCLIALTYAAYDPLINDDQFINKINSHPRASWKAGKSQAFDSMTLSQARKRLGAFLIDPETDNSPRKPIEVVNVQVPSDYSLLNDSSYSQCKQLHQVRNQGQCGSCWAFSGVEALADRLCIKSSGSVNVILSPQYLVSCDNSNYGCQGGILQNEWNFIQQNGVVEESCFPYASAQGQSVSCRSTCVNGDQWKTYGITSFKHFQTSDIEGMQTSLMNGGSLQVAFKVYQDFFNYNGGVYKHVSGGFAGGHAVKNVGWGVDQQSGLPYWLIANSWGPTWGLSGYFKILRGQNECGIEDSVFEATPKVN